ncbi:matrixin family metalloprotease [Nisaea sediminum]|uniref:matrixin family metalloprotease n=1 Tax=Nisaea sediminum TaxID=2775867 RepID=UPI00186938C7|nr:matrixin family metalloprotease [Nisaea sediminum]
MSTGDGELDALLAGLDYKWGTIADRGAPVDVTYSFSESLPSYYSASDVLVFAPMNETMREAARETLAAWQDVSGISFTEVEDAVGGQIRFGTDNDPNFAGYAFYPVASDSATVTDDGYGGDVFISSAYDYTLFPYAGNYGYLTFLHEIGHAIGLKHPFEVPTLTVSLDDSDHTVMSYNSDTDPNGNYVSTLGWIDIRAAQYLYGTPGSGTHGVTAWGTEAPESYSAADGITRYLANGGDDLVRMGAGDDIALGLAGADTLSGAGGGDLLFGGEGADSVDGGVGDDTLSGGAGADMLIGGSGADLACFDAVASGGTGRIDRDGGIVEFDGNDTLDGVELLRFGDGEIRLTFDAFTDRANFDEDRYLALNPDVAEAVAAGAMPSGYLHYTVFGLAEGRMSGASYVFDEAFYLESNPDVQLLVDEGILASGRVHFETLGREQGRAPNAFFDAAYYLGRNPDVSAAVAPGDLGGAYTHFVSFGGSEGRAPSAAFDSARYLDMNPDVAAEGINPLDHYLAFGVYEGRSVYALADYIV